MANTLFYNLRHIRPILTGPFAAFLAALTVGFFALGAIHGSYRNVKNPLEGGDAPVDEANLPVPFFLHNSVSTCALSHPS